MGIDTKSCSYLSLENKFYEVLMWKLQSEVSLFFFLPLCDSYFNNKKSYRVYMARIVWISGSHVFLACVHVLNGSYSLNPCDKIFEQLTFWFFFSSILHRVYKLWRNA